MAWVQGERRALASTFAEADPDQPTLCEGWTVRHLLAHLVQREHEPLSRFADQLSRPAPGHEQRMGALVDSARTREGYEALLARFAAGPPRLSPMAWADEAVNFLEYVIHHEDVRRGGGRTPGARPLPDKEQAAIWARLRLMARLGYRRSPVGVELALPSGERYRAHGSGGGVVLTGEPVELLLHATGRREAADVELSGAPESLQRFRSWVGPS
ncbi:MAG TPA: TIGR03085 family metal-binding protein [Actinomycetales bacterium]|nr:TIGR03085 family metal-binding protein [Actinomycetales bacterium]